MFSFWTLRLSAYSGKCLFEAGRLLNCRLFQPHILYQQNKEERTLLYLHTGYLRGGEGGHGGWTRNRGLVLVNIFAHQGGRYTR